jgi:hypothetical protein
MRRLKNRYAGETCLILGNGPSLNLAPVGLLARYPAFGTNRIYLMRGFTPAFYAAVNPLVIRQSKEQIAALGSTKFIAYPFAHWFPCAHTLRTDRARGFYPDIDRGIYEGYTVTYACLQIAYYLGFTRALLLGVDHRYQFEGQPNQQVTAAEPDVNHFSSEYFGPGVDWHLPDLERSRDAYILARDAYQQDGREIVNLTPGTALDVFETRDWRDYLE